MRKTKIICTMGPNTDVRENMEKLMENGMNIARFNFSHGSHEEHKQRLNLLREVSREQGLNIATLLDTKGPEIRTGTLTDHKKVTLTAGNQYTLTTKEIEGDDTIGHITYAGLPADIAVGGRILIDDGLIELKVLSKTKTDIVCEILNGGELGERKGVNVPNVSIKLPGITDKDKEDIIFGIEQGFDFIAASFVRNAQCIRDIKKILAEHNSDIAVISKIENAEGLDNIDEIIEVSDGIMIARGDLGVEIHPAEVPYFQKLIIKKCNAASKPVITATQMLDSMIRNPRPTRAEVTDVANAIYDGTDAIMLSGETAMGKYPVETLQMMVEIAESTEKRINYAKRFLENRSDNCNDVALSVAYASVTTALQLHARAILIPTISGSTAKLVSKLKPANDVIALSPDEKALRRMQIYWGVTPVKSVTKNSIDVIIDYSIEKAKEKNFVKADDIVVLTGGVPTTMIPHSSTTMMQVIHVK